MLPTRAEFNTVTTAVPEDRYSTVSVRHPRYTVTRDASVSVTVPGTVEGQTTPVTGPQSAPLRRWMDGSVVPPITAPSQRVGGV